MDNVDYKVFNDLTGQQPLIDFNNNTQLFQQHKCSLKNKMFATILIDIFAENHHNPNFTHLDLANILFISHRHLHRKLIAATGMNFSLLLRKYRLTTALNLCNSDLQIMQIAEKVGFSSCSYFIKCFKDEFGITPKQYQAIEI